MAHVYAEMIITHLLYIPMSERAVHNGETTLIILVLRTYPKTCLSNNNAQPRCSIPSNMTVDFSQRMHRRR